MKIPVVGFDPSMTHWGIAEGELDLMTGHLNALSLTLVEPKKITAKQVRQNSIDLDVAEQLSKVALSTARRAKAVFVEVPVGSQSARAMCAYGMCCGILGTIRAQGIELIEVTATEVKLSLSGQRHATKQQQIDAALAQYPDANWPTYTRKGIVKVPDTVEHLADAIGAIHAGVNTPLFQNLMRLIQKEAA